MQPALSVGSLVPDGFSGTVVSVHEHAVNIRNHDKYWMLSVVDREADLTALSVLVRSLPGELSPGQIVTISRGVLSIGTRTPILDLSQTRDRFSGTIPLVSGGSGPQAVCGRAGELRGAILVQGKPGGLRDLLAGVADGTSGDGAALVARAREVVGRVRDTVTDERVGGSTTGRRPGPSIDLSGLVGLGIGLTPSGDDFVMGFLAARLVSGADDPRSSESHLSEQSPTLDLEAVRARLSSTTLAGATVLHLALERSFPAYICRFVDDLRRAVAYGPRVGCGPEIARAVRRAVRHGESSGTDALTGFVYGLDVFCGDSDLDERAG